MTDPRVVDLVRQELEVDGTTLSCLTAGDLSAPPLLLLHGTFWSRVWQPVLPALGTRHHCVALDLPGFGRSAGELDVEQATVPALAGVVARAADVLGWDRFDLAAHDIGGGMAQHLAATTGRVARMVLMNAVMLDSWPVPAVERFRDPEVRAATTTADVLEGRRRATRNAVARQLSDAKVEDYVSPWHEAARARSWTAVAAAADARYTQVLVPALVEAAVPTRLVWVRDDVFRRSSTPSATCRRCPAATSSRSLGCTSRPRTPRPTSSGPCWST